MMEKDARIFVAGHRGMVDSAIVRELERQGYTNIVEFGGIIDWSGDTVSELDSE